MGTNAVGYELERINRIYSPVVVEIMARNWRDSAQLIIDLAVIEQEENFLNYLQNFKTPYDLYQLGRLFKFVPDVNYQTYRTPKSVILSEQGNCVASTIFVLAVMIKNNIVDHTTKIVFGGVKKNNPIHVWIEHQGVTIDLVNGRTKEKDFFVLENFAKSNLFPYFESINILN